jgi:hypothetical protein
MDLQPANLGANESSVARATSGSQQVGNGSGDLLSQQRHAFLWAGSAASAMDLHPGASYDTSDAYATDGTSQVGNATVGVVYHAYLWHGSPNGGTDLQPTNHAGYEQNSEAMGVFGNRQVGYASGSVTGGRAHAFTWTGSGNSSVDLHPSKLGTLSLSYAFGTNGSVEVGSAASDLTALPHAYVWAGTAASAIDLEPFLPPDLVKSWAYTVDAMGNIFGMAADSSGNLHSVEWVSQAPEPVSLMSSGVVVLILFARRRVRA